MNKFFFYLVRLSRHSSCSCVCCVQRHVRPLGGAAWCQSPGRWSPRPPPPQAWWRSAPSVWGGAAGRGRRRLEESRLQEEEEEGSIRNTFRTIINNSFYAHQSWTCSSHQLLLTCYQLDIDLCRSDSYLFLRTGSWRMVWGSSHSWWPSECSSFAKSSTFLPNGWSTTDKTLELF